MASPYDTMTIAQLRAEFKTLGDQLTVIQNDRDYIVKLIERRKAQAAAQARIATLSDLEKEALREALTP